jgi:predicted acetyltransferase
MSETIKDKLVIKKVTLAHINQYEELLNYVFQVTKRMLREYGYEEGEFNRSKQPILRNAEVLGWFTENDRLISSLSIYPFLVNIHGTEYEMAGLTGVGTYPEFSNMGLMNDLIKMGLEKMREAKQYISYLFPYSISYYRKKGWEIMSDRMTFTLKDTQVPKYHPVSGHVERKKVSDPSVITIYQQFAKITHGSLIRNQFEWTEYWRWENEEERTAAVYFDTNNNPLGYLFYWVENDIFHIKEMVYITQDARHGLWNFVGAHGSMIEEIRGTKYMNEPLAFNLDDSQIVETIEPYYMARIVDVKGFLSVYPWDDTIEPFHFVVSDPIAEWNNGIFGIRPSTHQAFTADITREPEGKAVKIDIQTLSTLFMSYKSPAYLHRLGRIQTDEVTLRMLEKLIPTEQPYFSDYF